MSALEVVAEAATWIDDNLEKLGMPEDWRTNINIRKLQVSDSDSCIFGQNGVDWMVSYNYPSQAFADGKLFNAAWKEYLK